MIHQLAQSYLFTEAISLVFKYIYIYFTKYIHLILKFYTKSGGLKERGVIQQ